MYYSDTQLKELATEYRTVDGKLKQLQERYLLRTFKNVRAKEHATQGFARRLKVMIRYIDNVFRTIPPVQPTNYRNAANAALCH
jgi:hypothetical protein